MHELNKYTPPDFTSPLLANAPDAVCVQAVRDGVAPAGFHSTSIYPEYFKLGGKWLMAEESRMDCVAVYDNGRIDIREFRRVREGDLVIVGRTEDGSEGIFVHGDGFGEKSQGGDLFTFRANRSRETAFSRDYSELCRILQHERDHGKIVWVAGPALAFDREARRAMSAIIEAGYVHALLAGNALATHDLEAAWMNTALGQDIYTQRSQPNGHYNHLDLINAVRTCGGISEFIAEKDISNGIIYSCTKKNVPYVLAGSIRDDGPLPPVYPDVYAAQDAMRNEIRGATTVICLASMLHSIAVGNMTPSYRVMPDGTVRPVYFYCVDVSEFAINKLTDRGSLAARGIVANVQDFIVSLKNGLGL